MQYSASYTGLSLQKSHCYSVSGMTSVHGANSHAVSPHTYSKLAADSLP